MRSSIWRSPSPIGQLVRSMVFWFFQYSVGLKLNVSVHLNSGLNYTPKFPMLLISGVSGKLSQCGVKWPALSSSDA